MNIYFVGDISINSEVEKILQESNTNPFSYLYSNLSKDDILIGNLESPITNALKPLRKNGPNLRMSPSVRDYFKRFNALSLANNHILDFGSEGLKDTIDWLNFIGVESFGADSTRSSAYRPYVIKRGHVSVAVIGLAEQEFNSIEDYGVGAASCRLEYSLKYILDSIGLNTHTIVFLHGGVEHEALPSPRYRKLCQSLIELGVSAVISSHTHKVGPVEFYRGAPIIYSLGNSFFPNKEADIGWNTGLMVRLEFVDSTIKVKLFGTKACETHVTLLQGGNLVAFEKSISALSDKLLDETAFAEEWEEQVKRRARFLEYSFLSSLQFKGAWIIFRLFGKLVPKRKRELRIFNVLSCDSHRDIIASYFRKRIDNRDSKIKRQGNVL